MRCSAQKEVETPASQRKAIELAGFVSIPSG